MLALRAYLVNLAVLIAPAAAQIAAAGTFSISPVRVELSGQQRTEALTVRNEEVGKDVVVQAQALVWSQHDGQDVLAETRDLIVTPPVFTLAGGAQQIIRVAVRRAPDAKQELTYRLIVQEVPPEAPKNFTGLQVALRLSLPIFIAPQIRSAPDLVWRSAWQADGSLRVGVDNHGNAHAQITDFVVRAKNSDAMLKNSVVKYVLPGGSANWVLQPSADTQQLNELRQAPLALRGSSDRGEIAAELSADRK
jgi:fimbrial chaperone protein